MHINRSHYRAYTINCFAFSKETNTGSGTPGNEATVHPYQKRDIPNLSERTSVFVCFALRKRTKPYEAELIQISGPKDNESARTTASKCRSTLISLPVKFRTNFQLVFR